ALRVVDRERVADRDRSDRRLPLQRQAGGDAELVELEIARAREHVAVVDEGGDARALHAVEDVREEELEGAGRLDRAAERLHLRETTEIRGRAEGVGGEAAHRAGAAGVEVLEEGQAAGRRRARDGR